MAGTSMDDGSHSSRYFQASADGSLSPRREAMSASTSRSFMAGRARTAAKSYSPCASPLTARANAAVGSMSIAFSVR